MVLFCPKCGEAATKGGNYCVRCGFDLREVVPEAQQPPSVQGALTADSGSPSPGLVASAKRTLFSATVGTGFLYSVLGFLTLLSAVGPVLFIGSGRPVTGNVVGPFAFWLLLLAFFLFRRRSGRATSLAMAVVVALGAIVLVGGADRLVNPERSAMETEWRTNPALVAMKEKDPKAYDALLSEIAKEWRTHSKAEDRQLAAARRIGVALRDYVLRASDFHVNSIYQAKHRHLSQLMKQDLNLCYSYAWGIAIPAKLPDPISAENKSLLATAIRSSSPSAVLVNIERAEADLERVIDETRRRLGRDSAVLDNLEKLGGDPGGTCKAMAAFSGVLIEMLPKADAANLVRHLMQPANR